MDLSFLDTRQRAHEGVEVPLIVRGETVYGDDDKPVTFTIKGAHDPEVHRLILQGRKAEARTPEEVLASDLKLANAAVIGWSDNWGIGKDEDGNPIKVPFSKAAIKSVFAIPAIRQAVIAEVFNSENFTNGL